MTPDVNVHEADTWTETSLDKQNGANSQESLVLFSDVRYAVVSMRKEWEKQGWSSEHGGESLHPKSFQLNRTNTSVVRRKMPNGRATARERNRSEAAQR
jgi:hypothetical protein